MHEAIRTRALSDAERAELKSSLPLLLSRAIPGMLGRYILFFLLFLAAGMSAGAILDSMLRNAQVDPTSFFYRAKPPFWALLTFAIAFWGTILLLPAYIAGRALRRDLKRHRERTRDRVSGLAHWVDFERARFVTLVDRQERDFFLFALDRGGILMIDGESARMDRSLFGLPEWEDDDEENDEDEEFEDDEHEIPMSQQRHTPFPNSSFVVHWLPYSGRILKIDVRGDVQEPERVLLANELPNLDLMRFVRDPERDALVVDRELDELLAAHRSQGL